VWYQHPIEENFN